MQIESQQFETKGLPKDVEKAGIADGGKASGQSASNQSEMTPQLLDEIIDKLIHHDKYEGFTIAENKGGASSN